MITALIMAGGKGTRFWPLSRENHPKQFLNIVDPDQTMLQLTVNRIKKLIPLEQIFIVTNASYASVVQEQLPELPQDHIILEPVGKNTAACIGLGAIYIHQKYQDATMVVLPADHFITNTDAFTDIVKSAVQVAEEGEELVTLGIRPTYPEVGYGYIALGNPHSAKNRHQIFEVEKFTEKPDYNTALKFLKEGKYLWNSGIFIWKVSTLLNNISRHMVNLSDSLKTIENFITTESEKVILQREYAKLDSVSIDVGILEVSSNILVMPCDFGWDDVGNWRALERLKETDVNGNVVDGIHIGIDTKNSIIHSQDKVIATIGLEDTVIINTQDSILVCPKDKVNEIKRVIQELKVKGLDTCL